MNRERIRDLGDELYAALRAGSVVAPLTERESGITIDDAYHVSLRFLERRTADGERVIGKKIGVTSKPVQDMLGVHQPDFGFLTDRMHYPNGAAIPVAGHLIAPRAEAEIAFRLKADLVGPNVTEADVLAATACIMPCFEIVDSRIRDWKIRIQDTVADNASCGVFVLGDREGDPRAFDLPSLHVRVFKNGQPLSEGRGAAVQGNPLTAVAWLANTLGRYDIPFKAGDIILSGSVVPLEPVKAGDSMHCVVEGLGEARCSFV
jgi:2-oxopent-4-enoate/cis-2-oxohex-4-enoate hydratase